MTTAEWIMLASSIGALSAALIALFTLLELFRQRKASYRPDLCVIQNSFELKDPNSSGLALEWRVSKHVHGEGETQPYLKLVNVGFGAAKNVHAKWSFDLKRLIIEVNRMAQRGFQGFYIEEGESFLQLKFKDDRLLYGVSASANEWSFEYLLPYTHDPDGRNLHLPPSYTLLVGAFLSLCVIEEETPFHELKIPSLTLDLDYRNIGKGSHRSSHRLECSLFSMRTSPGEAPEFELRVSESA